MEKAEIMANFRAADLYAITSEDHSLGRSNQDVVQQMIAAGITVIQYREKNKSAREMYTECVALRQITTKANATFIINDRVDLAMAVDADGVHIGQSDLPPGAVRKIIGENKILGLSTRSIEQAQAAAAEGIADYIGVGAIFGTATKQDASSPVGLDIIRFVAANLDLPFVVIGGIKISNIKEVKHAGASLFAIVTEIVSASDIGEAVRGLRHQLRQA